MKGEHLVFTRCGSLSIHFAALLLGVPPDSQMTAFPAGSLPSVHGGTSLCPNSSHAFWLWPSLD